MPLKNLVHFISIILLGGSLLTACHEDDSGTISPPPPLNTTTYPLTEVNNSGISGSVTFRQEADSTLTAILFLTGLSEDAAYPTQLRANTAAEGGNVTLELADVAGATRQSRTLLSEVTYEQVLASDGHITVQRSATDDTIVAQADIGGNALTGNAQQYPLVALAGAETSGTVLLEERINGTGKLTITLDSTNSSTDLPAYIHQNSAAEGGPVILGLAPIDAGTSQSITTIRTLNEAVEGPAITYDQLLNLDAHINVQQSSEDATVVAQADLGVNELTGQSVVYPLDSGAVPGIQGTATFAERKSEETLVTVALEGTPEGGSYPAHIRANTAVEGGNIVLTLTNVDGTTGIGTTHVKMLNNGTPVTYDRLTRYDGHLNVHLSEDEPGTLVSQGDIGGNALTGESVVYPLDTTTASAIRGEATFYQRNNGRTLAVIRLQNIPENSRYPTHIRANTAAEGGPTVISLNPVDGATGVSQNSIRQFDDGTPVTYEQLLTYDGHLTISSRDQTTLVAQTDIGQNALTGRQVTYPLIAPANFAVSGTATVAERRNGFSRVTLELTNTSPGNSYPAHVHVNSAAEGGNIAISLSPVDGTTGISRTHVESLDDNLAMTYESLTTFDGYVDVHQGADALSVIVAQGDIGINAAP